MAQTLQELLKNYSEFTWGSDQKESFEKLKTALTSEPVLGLFDGKAPTELHADASGYSLGDMLVQIQKGKEKVIAYASRTPTKAERNYWTTECKCLAFVAEHWLRGLKDPSGRLARWALRLQEYDLEIVYKSGKKHKDADSLSRNPIENEGFPSEQETTLASFSDIAEEQRKDPELSKLIHTLEKAEPVTKSFNLIDVILCKKNFDPKGRKWLPIIPKHLRLEILQYFHDASTAGHLGFAKTYNRIRKRLFWP
ncbi:transposon Ty3-I Gag-Pol polyprotein [Trichonephila clavipes]|nr:transposon Ty3-I Gag-Pol polyprotein [Trichonephila clavipes]